jgi:hypothetical protein
MVVGNIDRMSGTALIKPFAVFTQPPYGLYSRPD